MNAADQALNCADTKLIRADRWIVSSLLQKSIRRGEAETARRAARTLFAMTGAAIWRRFLIIAFEDVGIACLDAVRSTVKISTDRPYRKASGGDAANAVRLAETLAMATKDRSTDYLYCGALDHPSLHLWRSRIKTSSATERLRVVANIARTLPERAVAALCLSGVGTEYGLARDALSAELLGIFRELGVPIELLEATALALRRSREPIAVMAPLIWSVATRSGQQTETVSPVPATVLVNGVPLYALDKHTRLGRECIGRFARQNKDVRAVLERFVPERRWREAALMAAFYADAAPIAKRMAWVGSFALEAFGMETDLLKAGAPIEGHQPLVEAVRANLDDLNVIRAAALNPKLVSPKS